MKMLVAVNALIAISTVSCAPVYYSELAVEPRTRVLVEPASVVLEPETTVVYGSVPQTYGVTRQYVYSQPSYNDYYYRHYYYY